MSASILLFAGYPSTQWWNYPVTKSVGVAPTPGTADADAMAEYGAIHTPYTCRISAIHLHQIKDGTSGTNTIEVYRRRSGVMTLIASVSLASGAGDFGFASFTFVSEALRLVERCDYLYMQSTSVMATTGDGFVDVHFDACGLGG